MFSCVIPRFWFRIFYVYHVYRLSYLDLSSSASLATTASFIIYVESTIIINYKGSIGLTPRPCLTFLIINTEVFQ